MSDGDAGAADRRAGQTAFGRAEALAAFAEACALALPVHLLVTEAGPAAWAPGPFAAVFVPVFAGAAGAVAAVRDRPWTTGVVVAASIAAGVWLSAGDIGAAAVIVPATLLLGWRIVAIGLRDPVTPIGPSFVVVALALGAEAIAATGARPSWAVPLVVLIPLAFAAGLGSRAVTVWSEGDADELAADVRGAWIGRAGRAAVGLVAGMLAVAALGFRGGILDRLAAWLAPVGNLFASAFVWLASQVARPFLWLAERAGLDAEGLRRALSELQADTDDARRAAERAAGAGGSGLGRVLAFLLVGAVIVALVALIRRSRPTLRPFERGAPAPGAIELGALATEAPEGRRTRFDLPADRVRRWYAQTLVALDRAGLTKVPSATPAEFRDEVAVAMPQIAEGFSALTDAYQDVRYGSAELDEAALGQLRAVHRSLATALRRAGRGAGRIARADEHPVGDP